jgi:hypothetical protein
MLLNRSPETRTSVTQPLTNSAAGNVDSLGIEQRSDSLLTHL